MGNLYDLIAKWEKEIPIPEYNSQFQEICDQINRNYCDIHKHKTVIRRTCFFFWEDHDMGATIPNCKFGKSYGDCPCEGCEKYVSRGEAMEIVMKSKGLKEV